MNRKRFYYLKRQFLFYIVMQALLRVILFGTSLRVASLQPWEVVKTFLVGLSFDCVVGIYYCFPLALILLLLPARWFDVRKGRYIVGIVTFLMTLFTLFVAISQYLFWNEFHTNFNFIAVDYLVYTTEVIGNIAQSYNLVLLLPMLFILSGAITWWQMRKLPGHFSPNTWKNVVVSLLIIIALPVLFSHVVSDSWRSYASTNRYNVEISGNGPYSFVHAFLNNELDYNTFYAIQDNNLVIKKLRKQLQAANSTYENDTDVKRRINNQNALTGRRPNIVLITVESLSSDYLGAFGAKKSSTPYLDELSQQSYIFTNMLATGTRTVRGLEAISLAVPPTPGQSILRRPDCDDLATFGGVLDQNGYKSDFVYGGYGYFDNMNDFFSSNGYTIKDRVSIPKEEIFNDTIWGVADEILFTQVLKSMDEHYTNTEPAFEMVMTTTNHRPYKFPEGRVNEKQGTREGGAAYTDWAIHDFLERASQKPWFSNTVFVIVADHQADVAGRSALPVHKYRIPCIIYAPQLIQPGHNDRLISQMDIAPTLLGMLGISYESHFLGRDINQVAPGNERAFISTYQSMGFVRGDTLVVLDPGKQVTTYHIDDWMKSSYSVIDNNPALTSEAIAWYQGASYLFENGLLKQNS